MDTLLLQLNKSSDKPLYEQLYIGIKKAIISGQIQTHEKLPSKRQLADFLSISQTTVELAYAQLLDEGYIVSKSRVGFFVEQLDDITTETSIQSVPLPVETKNKLLYDFSPSQIDADSFPFTVWRKYARDLIDVKNKDLLQPGHKQGEYFLRQQIAYYLFESRGITCTPEQIVIGSGTEQLLPIILRLFPEDYRVAFENPGYSTIAKKQLKNPAIPLTVDEEGILIEEVEKSEANIVYITPSHQFPTGAVLSASRRTQLLKWALENNSRFIIEDDYDSEFRYKGKPIPALQGLDQVGKVIYMSTFTKSLMPSLRVAYFVLPQTLVSQYQSVMGDYAATVPRFEQHIVANFMKDGHFAKHLNRMRKIYRKKHDKILSIFEHHYPDIKITGDAAGMHMLISFPTVKSIEDILLSIQQKQLKIYPITNYLLAPIQYQHPTFLLGFGGVAIDEIEHAIHLLMIALEIKRQN